MGQRSPTRNKFNPTDNELIQVNGKPTPCHHSLNMSCTVKRTHMVEKISTSSPTWRRTLSPAHAFVCTIGLGSLEGEDIEKYIMAKETNQCVRLNKCFRFEKGWVHMAHAWIQPWLIFAKQCAPCRHSGYIVRIFISLCSMWLLVFYFEFWSCSMLQI